MLGDLNGRAISRMEVREAVNEMKSGKAPGLDGFRVECLKKGGMAVLEWIVGLLNISFDTYGIKIYQSFETSGLAWCMYSAHVQTEG